MERRYGKAQRIWVMDRGMVSGENLEFLKSDQRAATLLGRRRASSKRFEQQVADAGSGMPSATGWKSNCARARTAVRRHSYSVAAEIVARKKRPYPRARFEERIEEGLKTIAASYAKKRQTVAKIAERVGRLLGKNTAPQGFSKFKCVRVGRGARITWEKVETWRAWAQLSEGGLRVAEQRERLDSRRNLARLHPIDASRGGVLHSEKRFVTPSGLASEGGSGLGAHSGLFPGLRPVEITGTARAKAGLGDEPRRVLAELGELRTVDVVLTTKDGREIRTRCITQPTDHQKIILEHLGWELPRSLHPIQM